MPGSKERALEKARSLPADGLILDLEDAVGLAEKETARGLVAETVRRRPFGKREVIIRINGLDTPWGGADLEMAAFMGPDAILVPKVENAATVQQVAARLATLGAPERTRIWAMMETPLAMLNAGEIAGSSALLPGDGHQRSGQGASGRTHRDPHRRGDGARAVRACGAGL
jgi:citrate lyase beta subunit